MNYYNVFGNQNELTVNEGDRVEIIKRSALYCLNDEEPIYHSGRISEIIYEESRDVDDPVGMSVKFDKDTVYNEGEEDFIAFADVEELFRKKYEIVGYAMLNEGITLCIEGDNTRKIINFDYQNGDLIPVSIQDDSGLIKNLISDEDKKLIKEIMRYGTSQKFSHYVISKSNNI